MAYISNKIRLEPLKEFGPQYLHLSVEGNLNRQTIQAISVLLDRKMPSAKMRGMYHLIWDCSETTELDIFASNKWMASMIHLEDRIGKLVVITANSDIRKRFESMTRLFIFTTQVVRSFDNISYKKVLES